MEAVGSSELDDALFPQPPPDASAAPSQETSAQISQRVSEVECDKTSKEPSQEKWQSDKDHSEDVVNECDDAEEKKSDKKKDKKKSRIRRLFTGMRLKRSEEESGSSTEDDETESELTLESRETSATALEEGALVNKTAFTRIIHRVQTKANRMWEQIGQKLGGRAESDDEMTEESSKSLSVSGSELREGGDCPGDCPKGLEAPSEEVRSPLGDDAGEDDAKGKSGTLRRIASGLKSGLTNKQKNKN